MKPSEFLQKLKEVNRTGTRDHSRFAGGKGQPLEKGWKKRGYQHRYTMDHLGSKPGTIGEKRPCSPSNYLLTTSMREDNARPSTSPTTRGVSQGRATALKEDRGTLLATEIRKWGWLPRSNRFKPLEACKIRDRAAIIPSKRGKQSEDRRIRRDRSIAETSTSLREARKDAMPRERLENPIAGESAQGGSSSKTAQRKKCGKRGNPNGNDGSQKIANSTEIKINGGRDLRGPCQK